MPTKHKINGLEIWKAIGPPWLWTVFDGNHNLGSFKSFREARDFALRQTPQAMVWGRLA